MRKLIDKEYVDGVGQTPKGEKMPQTVEEFKNLLDLAEAKMFGDKLTISALRMEANDAVQRLEACRVKLNNAEMRLEGRIL